MPTLAISSYGIQIWLGDGVALAAVAVTGGTGTTPIVLTTAPHGIPVGNIETVTVAGVNGLVGANGTWQVQALSSTQVRLRGSVGSGFYTSGGTVQRTDTYRMLAEMTDLQDLGAMTTVVDVSAHDGIGWTSRIPTFINGNAIRINYNLVPASYVHNALTGFPYLMASRALRRWIVVFPDQAKTAWNFVARVIGNRDAAPVAGALTGVATLETDGQMNLVAA